TTDVPGVARIVRVGAEAAALVCAYVAPGLVVVPTAIAVLGLAATGHAAAVRPSWYGIGVDGLHFAASGIWAGGLVALTTLRLSRGWRLAGLGHLVERFSPVARTAFVATVLFGVLRSTQELSAPIDVLESTYG